MKSTPSSSAAPGAVPAEGISRVALEIALDLEGKRQRITRTGALGVGAGVASAVVLGALLVGVSGPFLALSCMIAATLGISCAVAALAISTVLSEICVRLHFRSLTHPLGLTGEQAARAFQEAVDVLDEQTRRRLLGAARERVNAP
jgi:hypothetical protein